MLKEEDLLVECPFNDLLNNVFFTFLCVYPQMLPFSPHSLNKRTAVISLWAVATGGDDGKPASGAASPPQLLKSGGLERASFVCYKLGFSAECFPDVTDVITTLLLLVEPPTVKPTTTGPGLGTSDGSGGVLTRCFSWL